MSCQLWCDHNLNFLDLAPCPPPFLSAVDFHSHAETRGLTQADIQYITKKCNITETRDSSMYDEESDFEAESDAGIAIWGLCLLAVVFIIGVLLYYRIRKRNEIKSKTGSQCNDSADKLSSFRVNRLSRSRDLDGHNLENMGAAESMISNTEKGSSTDVPGSLRTDDETLYKVIPYADEEQAPVDSYSETELGIGHVHRAVNSLYLDPT